LRPKEEEPQRAFPAHSAARGKLNQRHLVIARRLSRAIKDGLERLDECPRFAWPGKQGL